MSVLFMVYSRWVFVTCGSCVQVFGYSSHQLVCTLRHDAPVTAAMLNPRNHLQVVEGKAFLAMDDLNVPFPLVDGHFTGWEAGTVGLHGRHSAPSKGEEGAWQALT